jgi:tetratricopeptide (TPR) repeat protein
MLKANLLFYLKKASKLITEKKYIEATDIYKQLLAEIPSFPDAYYGLYKVNYLQNEKQNAKIYLSNALKQLIISSKKNKEHKIIFQKWELEYKQAFGEFFLTSFEDSIESHSKHSIIKNYKNKKYLTVINSLEKLNRYDIELFKIAFFSYVELNIIHKAINKAYELLYYIEDDDKELLESIAKLFETSNLLYPSAQVYLYLSNRFNQAKYFKALGILSIKLDNHPQAKKFLEKAVEIDNSSIKHYTLLGQVYSIDGEYDKLEKLLKYANTHIEKSYDKLISLLFDIGNIDGYEFDKELISNDIFDGLYFIRHQLLYNGLKEAKDVLESIKSKHNFAVSKSKTRDKIIKQKLKDFENIIAFHTSGRGGSFFFHSLIDGHKEVATIPGVYLKGYFGLTVFNGIVSADAKDMVEKFMKIYEAIFDASSFKTVPGDPMGGKIKVGDVSGLTNLGENRDIVLKVDKIKFARKLYGYLNKFSVINEKDFFKLIHIVWEEVVRGDNLRIKKSLFYHIHNPNFIEYYRYLNNFKKAKDLVIIRNWLQGLESWMDSDVPIIRNK